MAEKNAPVGTEKVAENPELLNLKEREKMILEKIARLEKLDHAHQARGGVDLNQVKHQNAMQLAEIRKAIADLSK